MNKIGTNMLICNIHSFSQLLKHHCSQLLNSHKVIRDLWKGKKELATNQLEALFLKLWDYTSGSKCSHGKKMFLFVMYYLKFL